MKKIFKIVLALAFILTSSYALEEKEIKSVMTQKINEALIVLKNQELKQDSKADEIIKIIDPVFDYKTMARISLGKKWKTISSEQKTDFAKAFEEKLKISYIDKLKLYTNQKVEVLDLVKTKKNRITLKSQVIGKDKIYKIDYKFHKNKKTQQWFIYDVNLIGVSVVFTYKKQFAGLLKEKNFDEVLALLKDTKQAK